VPQIIVSADLSTDRGEGAVMLRERVNVADFESDHFAAQLVERLGWAVNDAHEAEQDATPVEEPQTRPDDAVQTSALSAPRAS
jgi:hypothetical protein